MTKENTKIRDFDKKPLTVADIQEQTRIYMERMNTNKVAIAGRVREKRVSEPKPKVDKKTGELMFDKEGNQLFWNPYYSVTVAFEGGEMSIDVKPDWYGVIEIENRVLFEGSFGLSFGHIEPVFHKYTVL